MGRSVRRGCAAALATALMSGLVAASAGGAADKTPRLLGYEYIPPTAPGKQATLEVDLVDPDGQIVALQLGGAALLVADSGCGYGGHVNGDPAHFILPIPPLADGPHGLMIRATTSTCRAPGRVATRQWDVSLSLPDRPGTGAHARCDSATATRLVRRFARALSAGRLAEAAGLWSLEPSFEWYSTSAPGERLNDAARDRSSLHAYFRARIAKRERLTISRLTATYEARRDIANFHGVLRRRASDLPAATYSFKGAARCSSVGRRLIVWSMSARDAPLVRAPS